MTQFLRDQISDSEEVVTPLMLDGTYLSRNFATLGPLTSQPPCEENGVAAVAVLAVNPLIRLLLTASKLISYPDKCFLISRNPFFFWAVVC